MLAGNPTDCLNHMVMAKLVTLPKPNAVLVTAAKFPLPPWLGFEERFKARLPVVNPATPEFAAPWRLVLPPFLSSLCKVTFTPPPLGSLGVVVPELMSSKAYRNLRVGPYGTLPTTTISPALVVVAPLVA